MNNKKIKVLNLYAGIGGNRKLWKDVEVTAIELFRGLTMTYSRTKLSSILANSSLTNEAF